MGMIYQRGNVWWIKYYRNGRYYRESTKTTKKMVAQKLLERREGEIAQGKMPSILFEKVTFEELAEDFVRDYRINQKRSLTKAERSVNHLKRFFENYKATQIVTSRINEYVEIRLEEEAANATINRELAALKRMLNMGTKQTPPLVDRVPHIPMLRENNVRKGFFEHEDFLKLRETLPEYLRDFITFGYKTGWRISEIQNLTWNQVDMALGIVRLEVGESKNDEGRIVYLDEELKAVFNRQWERRKRRRKLCSYVFPNRDGTDRMIDIRSAWYAACKEAGIGRRLFHDFRRTAVRNMVRAGIPERVAMMISGHKTRSVFDRYNIVSDQDLKMAAARHANYLDSLRGHNLGTICLFPEKKGSTQ
jgi:integrase